MKRNSISFSLYPRLLSFCAFVLMELVAASPAKAVTIVQNTAGTGRLKGPVEGQPFTTPGGGPWNNIAFNFFSDQGVTPVAVGKAYIFTSAFTGTPVDLASSSFLAVSTGVSSGQYIFTPSFTLMPNTQYFMYSDTPTDEFPNGIGAGGCGVRSEAPVLLAPFFNLSVPGSNSTNFRVSGNGPPPPPPFDTCLKDNSTGNLLQWNSTTGRYKFTRGSDGFMLTGTGTVGLVNGIRTLTDFKSDRRISAGLNTGQLTGNATIYLQVAQGVWQVLRIIDTNPAATCSCGP